MSAADLIARARSAGLKLTPKGPDCLNVRGPKPLPAELLEDLRARKLEILEELEAERAREAAVDSAWRRLQVLYLRAGSPQGWLTSRVREADRDLQVLWRATRVAPHLDADFRVELQRWETLAAAAIRRAADGETQ